MPEISRRHLLAGSAATVAAAALPAAVAEAEATFAVFVPYSEIPIGKTLQTWERGLPYIRGAVMRSGDWWYICGSLSAMDAAESGDDVVCVTQGRRRGAREP